MLALRPELVQIQAAASDLTEELRAASSERGESHAEQFVDAIVDGVRTATGSGEPRR